MKLRYLYLFAMLLSLAMQATAQEDVIAYGPEPTMEPQRFRFIYVAPDNNMSQNGLIEALVDHHNHIMAEESPAIFYLSYKPDPIIVKINTGKGDNPDDFESELLYTLRQSMSYNVTPDFDRSNILNLLNENEFIDENGKFIYENLEFDFHVGKVFWDSGNNESVIAAIYFNINAKKYIEEDKIQFNVIFRCPPSKGTLDRETPFGELNFDDINEIVIPRVQD